MTEKAKYDELDAIFDKLGVSVEDRNEYLLIAQRLALATASPPIHFMEIINKILASGKLTNESINQLQESVRKIYRPYNDHQSTTS